MVCYIRFNYFFSTISYPTDWSLATRIVLGFITSILFLISILLHELMHSIVAQREGIPVHSITLFILGGVSQMTKEPEKPGDEFRMALAGPLSSLVLGGIFYGLWYLSRESNTYIATVTSWMGFINVSLGVFNLIPGFPLDGGRVLRAILWWLTNNLRRATKIASTIGRGVGYLFIFGGIYLIFTANWLQGVWIILIGWFLENAAVGSYRQLALMEVLKGHQASEIMTRDCLMVPAETTVDKLINEQILTSGRRCFPVVAEGRVIGMVTLHNVKTVPQEQRSIKTVRDVMSIPRNSETGTKSG